LAIEQGPLESGILPNPPLLVMAKAHYDAVLEGNSGAIRPLEADKFVVQMKQLGGIVALSGSHRVMGFKVMKYNFLSTFH